jgi:hypothetical protein
VKQMRKRAGRTGIYRDHGIGTPGIEPRAGLVLGFFVFAWISLVTIMAAAPGVYDEALRLPGGECRSSALAFLVAHYAFLLLLGVVIVRRWR